MTAVPPPVPPEIVDKGTDAIIELHRRALAFIGAPSDRLLRSWSNQFTPMAHAALAAVYGDIVEAARRDAPCPTCQGRNRATTDMVCMACGRDYMPDDGSDESPPGLGWLRLMKAWREQAKLIQANNDTLRAGLAERDAALAEVERLRERSTGLRAAELAYDEARAENVRLRAELADRDRAVRDARRDALTEAAEAIRADVVSDNAFGMGEAHAARIVAGLRDSEATG